MNTMPGLVKPGMGADRSGYGAREVRDGLEGPGSEYPGAGGSGSEVHMKAGTPCTGDQRDILLVAQSINGLLWVSQLCLSTTLQLESIKVA